MAAIPEGLMGLLVELLDAGYCDVDGDFCHTLPLSVREAVLAEMAKPRPPAGQQDTYCKSQVKRIATLMGWEPKGGQQDRGEALCGCEKAENCKRLTDCRIKWAMRQAAQNIGQKVEVFAASPPRGMTPLTEEQIQELCLKQAQSPAGLSQVVALVRSVESAHGIGIPPTGSQGTGRDGEVGNG